MSDAVPASVLAQVQECASAMRCKEKGMSTIFWTRVVNAKYFRFDCSQDKAINGDSAEVVQHKYFDKIFCSLKLQTSRAQKRNLSH
jgi:hypothetical protein